MLSTVVSQFGDCLKHKSLLGAVISFSSQAHCCVVPGFYRTEENFVNGVIILKASEISTTPDYCPPGYIYLVHAQY